MGVQEFAKHLGITPDTVRYYSRIGFLNPKKDINNGYREFGRADLERMVFILRARQLGLTGSDIAKIFDQVSKGATPCPLVRKLLDDRLHEIERELQESKKLHERIKYAMNDWKQKPDQPNSSDQICSLIEELEFLDERLSRA